MEQDLQKIAVGKAAAALVKPGMVVGLGTGSTAKYFIEALIKRCQEGLKISAIATSEASHRQALAGSIPMVDPAKLTKIDLTVDGADQIDQLGRLIKGGGGALLREKMIADISEKYVIIADKSKEVDHLGKFPLAVEIIPFLHEATIAKLNKQGFKGHLRLKDGLPYKTDQGNYIYDINLIYPCKDPEEQHRRIRSVIGVVETGFFFIPVTLFLIGQPDGTVIERPNRN